MWQDPIVAETRALRDEYARQFNYDIAAIFADIAAKEAMHPEGVVSFPPRRPALYKGGDRQKDVYPQPSADPAGDETSHFTSTNAPPHSPRPKSHN